MKLIAQPLSFAFPSIQLVCVVQLRVVFLQLSVLVLSFAPQVFRSLVFQPPAVSELLTSQIRLLLSLFARLPYARPPSVRLPYAPLPYVRLPIFASPLTSSKPLTILQLPS